MKQQGLISKQPSKKWRYCRTQTGTRFENKLRQQFDTTSALVADVTYIKVKNKWHYLSTIMESKTRRLVSWEFFDIQDATLAVNTLNKAMSVFFNSEKPRMFHSDQGSIYGSELFISAVKCHNLEQSMSKRGYC